MLKRIDRYIVGKFLGTFFLSIVLILSIAIVFDLTEKLDDFYEEQLTAKEIIFGYYIHFIPYYANMFSSLFIFLSVIFFTSKLAGNSEIIAILASGVSYERFLMPYFLSAFLLFGLQVWLSGFVIPPASEKLLTFTDKHVEAFSSENARNVQLKIDEHTILYMESFQSRTRIGYRASLETFEGKTLRSRIVADRVRCDSNYHWHFENYTHRKFEGMKEELIRGYRLDTILNLEPQDIFMTAENAQMMTNPELRAYMRRQQERGSGNLNAFKTEYHKRWAGTIGAFIMTLLGVTMSSKKVRGGMGKNLGVGILLTALYILFSTVSTTFSVSGVMTPFVAAWLPNFVFLGIGVYLYFQVRK